MIADIGLRPESEAFVKKAESSTDGPKVVFAKTDVTDWAQLERVFDVAEKEFGEVPDVICPGAGIYEPVSFSLSTGGPRIFLYYTDRDTLLFC